MKLTFRLNKTADFIFDYLTDMEKFVSVHPVIFKIDKTSNEHYLVHEKLKIGFVAFPFTYPVTIVKNNTDKVIIIQATVMKYTKIVMKFVFITENDQTIIEEDITFESPLPVKFIMQSIFRKQHSRLFKNIEMK